MSFDNAEVRRFDFVVAADGIGSTTRGLVFGNDVSERPIGMEMTYLTVPRANTEYVRSTGGTGYLAL